jgi:hypothetical protein
MRALRILPDIDESTQQWLVESATLYLPHLELAHYSDLSYSQNPYRWRVSVLACVCVWLCAWLGLSIVYLLIIIGKQSWYAARCFQAICKSS